MRHWLFKTEPDVFSIADLKAAAKQTTCWEGVRNYQARNFMRDDMQVGDQVLVYHSGGRTGGRRYRKTGPDRLPGPFCLRPSKRLLRRGERPRESALDDGRYPVAGNVRNPRNPRRTAHHRQPRGHGIAEKREPLEHPACPVSGVRRHREARQTQEKVGPAEGRWSVRRRNRYFLVRWSRLSACQAGPQHLDLHDLPEWRNGRRPGFKIQ